MIDVFVLMFLVSLLVISNIEEPQTWMLLAVIGLFWVSLMLVCWRSTPKYRHFRFRHERTEVDMISMRGYDPRHRRWARHALERYQCQHGVDWRALYPCIECSRQLRDR